MGGQRQVQGHVTAPVMALTLTANPRGSRRVSGEPRSWMTVEKRTMTGVWTPGARKRSAAVRLEMSCVTCAGTDARVAMGK